MAMKWLGIALALSAVVLVALFPSASSSVSSEQVADQELLLSVQKSIDAALTLRAELSGLHDDLDWAILYVDSLYDYMRLIEDETSQLQHAIDAKIDGSLFANLANLYPVLEHADRLENLTQEFQTQDELPELTSSAYEKVRIISGNVEMLIEELQAVSDNLAQTP